MTSLCCGVFVNCLFLILIDRPGGARRVGWAAALPRPPGPSFILFGLFVIRALLIKGLLDFLVRTPSVDGFIHDSTRRHETSP